MPKKKIIVGINKVVRDASKKRAFHNKYVIGIDEVGRGPLAGPIVVAAVATPSGFRPRVGDLPLRDSKKLTALQKEGWFEYVRQEPRISFATARVYPKNIDRLNVSRAANRAATRAFLKLATSQWGLGSVAKVYLDGGLYLDKRPLLANGYSPNSKTLVRGDEKINAIKLASIVAKVQRDRYMVKLHNKYPQYGFDEHKGYGTKKHRQAIKKYGIAYCHRKSFCKFVL
ncbi:MAG TPA: ribonuclease HII [Candidatus Paceibacterota bacterium]|nr:ribonuclease HII [Candidatus Paceibacterota bacterium]